MTYEVTLKPSSKSFVAEEDLTILDAAVRANIMLPHSCRDGSCGTCKSRLVSGQVNQSVNLGGISGNELAEGYILTCVAKPMSNVEIESTYYPELDGIKPAIYPCKLKKIRFPDNDIAILNLRLPPNSDLKYLPGQYIDLIWSGVRRSYSIANAPSVDKGLELHIRKVLNGVFSSSIFEGLREETLLRLEGPFGSFFVHDSDAPIIFLAGGTGFAPVKAMVEKLLSDCSDRLIYIYWGVQSRGHLYTELPDVWQKKYENITFIPVLSGIDNQWTGRHGLVHEAVLEDFPDLAKFEIYACGSPGMIAAAKSDFLKHGCVEKNFFSDAFTPFKQ